MQILQVQDETIKCKHYTNEEGKTNDLTILADFAAFETNLYNGIRRWFQTFALVTAL